MRMNLCYAAFGLAMCAGTGTVHAQTVITREIVNPPADTFYTPPPTETVITRQPVPTMPVETVVEQPYRTVETIQTQPAPVVTRQVTTTRQATRNRKSAKTARRSTATKASLTPVQQRTIYRVIRRERIVPAQTVTERVVTTPVQRVITAPAYPPPPTYVAPGYEQPAYTEFVPEQRYDAWADSDRYESDRYPDQVVVPQTQVVAAPPPVAVERVVTAPAGIVIGSRLPSTVPVYAMPPAAIARVPNVSGYRYAYVNDRIVLVDPNTNIVMATIRQ